MNSAYENSSQEAAFLDSLIAANGRAAEVREQVLYQPVVYALPEEWRQAEAELLEQAVRFQPELYRLISLRATRQEIQQMQEQQLRTIRTEQQELMRSIRSTLEQDGSVREQYSSELSKMLSDGREELHRLTLGLEDSIRKIIIGTAVSSAALSVLVCLALLHWAG